MSGATRLRPRPWTHSVKIALDIRLLVPLLLELALGSLAGSRSGTWIQSGLRGISLPDSPLTSARLARANQLDAGALCASLKGLSQGQEKLCQLSHDHMAAVARGARTGIRECQHQFKHRRWNCSTNDDESVFGPVLDIGDYLLDKYDGATEVKVNRRGRLAIKDPRYSLPTANDLVYLGDSPNYCFANSSLGSLGTRGRACNRTSSGIDGCNLLCCGRGYNTQKSVVSERCDCKFHWCCQVKCSTCNKSVDLHTCK